MHLIIKILLELVRNLIFKKDACTQHSVVHEKIYKPPKMQTCFTDSRFISLTCQNMRASSDTKLMKRTFKRDIELPNS